MAEISPRLSISAVTADSLKAWLLGWITAGVFIAWCLAHG